MSSWQGSLAMLLLLLWLLLLAAVLAACSPWPLVVVVAQRLLLRRVGTARLIRQYPAQEQQRRPLERNHHGWWPCSVVGVAVAVLTRWCFRFRAQQFDSPTGVFTAFVANAQPGDAYVFMFNGNTMRYAHCGLRAACRACLGGLSLVAMRTQP